MCGHVVLELPPSTENPRNSEGSFVTLADGTILLVYSRFAGGGGDHDRADLAVCRSADAGRTWSDPEIMLPCEGRWNTMSVSLLRLADGRIALFYLVKNGLADCRPRMRISTDEGASWSDPTRVIAAPGYFVVNNDRVVQLRSGRLIVPACYHRLKADSDVHAEAFDGRGIAIYFVSDDAGATWHEADTWWALPVASRSGLQEPGVIELADGRLFSWCRTSTGCQWALYSEDAGQTWTAPQPTEFRSPCSPMSIQRIPATGELLAVWNDHSGRSAIPSQPSPSSARTPLVTAVSADESESWSAPAVIEDDPEGGFCYTAVHFTDDGHVLLGYCAGGPRTGGILNLLRVRRIPVDALRGEA